MVDQVLPNQLRAFDDNGDPAGGALLYIYETGTTTPVTVYTDSALSIAHSSPIVADGDGYFAQIFYGGTTSLKAVIQDSAAAELQTIDPAMQIGLTGGAASLISFSPTASINSTNVQDAIEEVATAATVDLANATTLTSTAGSSGTYTLTAASTITAYATGQMFRCIANHTASGSTNTLNVDSLGAETMKVYDSGSGGKRNLTNFDLKSNDVFIAMYDGTDFVCTIEAEGVADTTRKGKVKIATAGEITAGTINKVPDVAGLNPYIVGYTSSAQTITAGAQLSLTHGLGGEPRWVGFILECTSAEHGYSVGHRILVDPSSTSSTAASRFNSIRVTSTQVIVRLTNDATVFTGANATTGAAVALTNGSWDLYVRAVL